MLLGRCHLCGCALRIHSYFVAEGYQHEEYYCHSCGEFSRGAIRLRSDDPAWQAVYARRQALIKHGPPDHGLLRRRRRKDSEVRRWSEQIYELTRQLVEAEQASSDAGAGGRKPLMRP
ncbi:MAG: hypothetical protein ACPMAQ_07475 [Phycisphaerae bacterium]